MSERSVPTFLLSWHSRHDKAETFEQDSVSALSLNVNHQNEFFMLIPEVRGEL